MPRLIVGKVDTPVVPVQFDMCRIRPTGKLNINNPFKSQRSVGELLHVYLGGQQSLILCQISAAGQRKASMSVEDINVEFHKAMLRKLAEHPGNGTVGKARPCLQRSEAYIYSCRVVVKFYSQDCHDIDCEANLT